MSNGEQPDLTEEGEEAPPSASRRLRRSLGLAPPQGTGALPDRVREAIARQEARAEVVIGWLQLAIVCTFGILYTLAAKPVDSAMGDFRPVPYALAAYLAFTLLRLTLTNRGFAPGWLLVTSIVIDFALLFGLIWSFHLQYNQPAVFYLKVPTLLYVFIFIAIRALRFDPRYVLTAGLVAALGWSAMVVYAVNDSPAETVITRDFTVYLTSNTVLLGAEFDKIISILVVTGILTVALARARALLVKSVREGTAAGDLRRFFSPEIAEAITESSGEWSAGEGEAREAAILMVDLKGFTRFAASLPPQEVVTLLASYQAAVLPVVRAQGGTVDKFLGDGIMVTFGAARSARDPVAAALRTLEAVVTDVADGWNRQRAAQGQDRPLTIKGAVTSGRVVYGAVGDASRLEFTVIGDAVNLAAKLEKFTEAEGALALTTEESWERAATQNFVPTLDWKQRGDRVLEPGAEPMDLRAIPR